MSFLSASDSNRNPDICFSHSVCLLHQAFSEDSWVWMASASIFSKVVTVAFATSHERHDPVYMGDTGGEGEGLDCFSASALSIDFSIASMRFAFCTDSVLSCSMSRLSCLTMLSCLSSIDLASSRCRMASSEVALLKFNNAAVSPSTLRRCDSSTTCGLRGPENSPCGLRGLECSCTNSGRFSGER